MSRPLPSPGQQVQFLQQLQRVLSDGGFVATYKFALLHALADLAVIRGDDTGDELPLKTRDISEQLIELYWRQAAPFPSSAPAILRQNTGNQASIVSRIATARAMYGEHLGKLKQSASAWASLVRKVDATLREMPLWKLQTVGNERLTFLYDNIGAGDEVVLKPGIAYCFRAFYDLILDLVRGAWLRFVRSRNLQMLGTTVDLSEFLFGSDRSSLSRYLPVLMESEQGECFYCAKRINGDASVDHFIPWSRYPVDLGHNFVLAHGACNSRKADYLAAERHLERWVRRDLAYGTQLSASFTRAGLLHDAAATREIAHWAYSTAHRLGSSVWVQGRILEPLSSEWVTLLRGTR
jgi:hypothetical protein